MKDKNELLLHIYKSSDMGVKSMKKILKILKNKDNKIKKDISRELKEYEKMFIETKKIIKKNNIINPTISNIMISIMANMSMSLEIDKDNSDAKIADIILRGYTMGILEMEKKIEDYKDIADKDILNLSKKLLSFQKKEIEILKTYL